MNSALGHISPCSKPFCGSISLGDKVLIMAHKALALQPCHLSDLTSLVPQFL